MTDAINRTELDATNYLKLFMQELTYQDPLQPLDNREFMAQMAQFSSLQEERATNQNLTHLLEMSCLNFLGKTATLKTGEEVTVSKVQFYDEAPPKLVVTHKDGVAEIELAQVAAVS